jgi:hypothetical protein
MRELVLAVFDAASAADAAVQDLEVARIPSAVIQRGVRDGPELRDNSSASARPSVIVAVDEMHARHHGNPKSIWPARNRGARCGKPSTRIGQLTPAPESGRQVRLFHRAGMTPDS